MCDCNTNCVLAKWYKNLYNTLQYIGSYSKNLFMIKERDFFKNIHLQYCKVNKTGECSAINVKV